tara:strand:+ start:5223 stop:5885 length:663 start_codon:yes stop_codon:yes gene_type:complete
MQLSEFTYIFLTLCIPFLLYIVRSTNPKKGFSILFVLLISTNIFLIFNNFSQIGLFFLAVYLIFYKRKEKFYYLGLAFISFIVSSLDITGFNNIKNFVPILLISAVFSSMMIGHWFLVDPTINREGMKNIAKFSMYLSFILSVSVLTKIYESSTVFFNIVGNELLNNVIVFLFISAGILSYASLKSLQEKSYTGVMASTGLSYLSLIVSLGASGTLILSL